MTRLLAIPATAAVLTLGLSGCAGGSDDTVDGVKVPEGASVSTKPGGGGSIRGIPTLDPQRLRRAAEFVVCMRALGYDMPEASDPAFNFSPKNADRMDQQQLLKLRKHADQCFREHGGRETTG